MNCEHIEVLQGSMAGPAAGLVSIMTDEIYTTLAKIQDAHYGVARALQELVQGMNRIGHMMVNDECWRDFQVTCDVSTNPADILDNDQLCMIVQVRTGPSPTHWGGSFTCRRDRETRTLFIEHTSHGDTRPPSKSAESPRHYRDGASSTKTLCGAEAKEVRSDWSNDLLIGITQARVTDCRMCLSIIPELLRTRLA